MKNTINKNRTFFALVVILFITGSLALFFMMSPKTTPVYADLNVDIINYERYIPTLEDDFEDNKIIVTLTRNFSKVNKAIDKQIFSTKHINPSLNSDTDSQNDSAISTNDIIIKSIEDLTYFSNPSVLSNNVGFNQILSIELQEHNKQKVLDAISELEELDFVLAAEPSYNYIAVDNYELPDDTYFSEQWALDNGNENSIQLSWNITQDSSTPMIKVGIFETSVQSNHPDLRVIPGNFIPSNEGASAKHGTHVAGIIGAITNNNLGISGIAPVEIALLNRNTFVDSLTWAIENDIKIINASYCLKKPGTEDTPAKPNVADANALRMFGENGGLFIAAAGNHNCNTDSSPYYPAGYADKRKFPDINNVISVGAIDKYGNKAGFSCYGENSVQIYAPGVEILSTFPTSLCESGNCRGTGTHFANGYHYMNGTSMATPQVTGVAALLLSNSPNLSTQQIKEFILDSATEITISTQLGNQVVKKLNANNAFVAVDFISNGQVMESWSVYNGSLIENLPNPTLIGYDFGGWYDNSNYTGTPYTNGSLWESNQTITLYAKWIPQDCTIFFDGYGGIVYGDNPITVKYGETFSTNITVNKTGNVLDGWYDSNNVKYITADGRSTKPWDKLGTTTLKAKWSPKSYEIQINDDGNITWLSNNGLSNDKCYIQYGTVLSSINLIAIFKQSNQGFKEGKIFDHFEYNDSTLDWTIIPDLGENNSVITIVPIWINEVHTISFESLCDMVVSSIVKEYDSNITLPTPSRTGYTFNGWYTAKTGGTLVTWTTMPDLTPTEQNNGSTQLIANWTAITYKIYYNANGGTGTMSFSTHTYDVESPISKNDFVKTGHDFMGWAKSSNGEVTYTDSQGVKNLANKQSATVTLYAVWQPQTYKIIYRNLTTDMVVTPTEYTYGIGVSTLPKIKRMNANEELVVMDKFYGWFSSNTFSNPIYAIRNTEIGDVILYAKYNYFVQSIEDTETHKITDAGASKNIHLTVEVPLKSSLYEIIKNTTLTKIRIEFSITLWEEDDGYQHIYLYNGEGFNGILFNGLPYIVWSKKIDHSSSKTKKTYSYTIELDISQYKDTDSFVFGFDASGAFSDDWKFNNFKASVYLID
ncbi:MAG: S8 family serine peptidase [Clostridiales bacterium]|nr:S8 family serine peptidase [Clostridiales bacterium]